MSGKIQSQGFPTWQIKLILMHEGVWSFIAEDYKSVESTDLQQLQLWKKQNDRAIALFKLSLSDSLIYHIDFKSTAKESWDRLEGFFGNCIINSKLFLK